MPLAGSDAVLKELLKTAFQQATASYDNAVVNTTVTGSCSTGPITGAGIGTIA